MKVKEKNVEITDNFKYEGGNQRGLRIIGEAQRICYEVNFDDKQPYTNFGFFKIQTKKFDFQNKKAIKIKEELPQKEITARFHNNIIKNELEQVEEQLGESDSIRISQLFKYSNSFSNDLDLFREIKEEVKYESLKQRENRLRVGEGLKFSNQESQMLNFEQDGLSNISPIPIIS